MKSMTGYARAHKASSQYILDVAIRTVNSRFLDLRFHLPKELGDLEIPLRKELQGHIRRGTVDVSIYWTRVGSGSAKFYVDEKAAQNWIRIGKKLAKDNRLHGDSLSVRELLSLPHVVQVKESYELAPHEKRMVVSTFRTALQGVVKERAREGSALRKVLFGLINDIEKNIRQIKLTKNAMKQKAKTKFESRLKDLGLKNNVDPQRFHQELVYQLDKMDIREELDRLNEHLKLCKQKMRGTNVKGKTLEFYSQEILREINTIGSKIQEPNLTGRVVDSKTLVESLREQVQNVE